MRIWKSFFVTICATIILSSCASIAPTKAARVSFAKLYEVLSSTRTSLEGDFIVNDLVLYKKIDGIGGIDAFSFGKLKAPEEKFKSLTDLGYGKKYLYYFTVYYQGRDWKFIDKLSFKTDTGLFKLTALSPNRDVMSTMDTSYTVETAQFYLSSDEQVDSLLNTSTLQIQYTKSKIFNLTADEIQKIKDFIKNDIITTQSKNW